MPETPRRAPLDADALRAELVRLDVPWRDVSVVATTGSTNADAAALARRGAATGTAVAADEQTAGRGRLQRGWASPAGGSLSLSVVLRPTASPERWGWVPLLAGVGVVEAALALGVPDAALKWPNDVVVDGPDRAGGPGPRKWGGILAERVDVAPTEAAVVVGVGLNVDLGADELPTDVATSLVLERGAALPARELLAAAVLGRLASWFERWEHVGGDAQESGLRYAYRAHCATLGRDVRVELPGGSEVGRATDVDDAGRLQVVTARGRREFSSGEVVHLRAT